MSAGPAARVLVVDDDPYIREFVELALAMQGHEVRAAANGRDALDTLAAWRADVVLLDLMMPTMDGWEFRRRQAADPKLADAHVIVMSANRSLPAAEAVLNPCAMLAKPFNLNALLDEVRGCTSGTATLRSRAG